MISLNFVSIIGGFAYIVNKSFIFPIIGSLLLGSPVLMQPVAFGEMSRAYSPKDVAQKLPLMTLSSYVGYFPAALSLHTLKNLKFYVGPFLIEYENVLGVIMPVCYFILQVLTVFFVHDLSLEYDLKSALLSQKIKIRKTGNATKVCPASMNSPRKSLTDHSVQKHITEYEHEQDHNIKKPKTTLNKCRCFIDIRVNVSILF